MKSGTRNLIVAAVCAAVLGGAAFALSRAPGEGGAGSSAASSGASLELISKKSQDVVSMKVTNKKGTYTLVPEPQKASSAASGSASSESDVFYTVKGLEDCPINTSATESVVRNGFSLAATKNLGTVSSLSQYGLSNPQATVEVQFKDGTTFNYKIGNQTATDTTAYYMCGQTSDNVYVVSADEGILEDEKYFVSKELLAVPKNAASSSSSSGQTTVDYDFTKLTLSGSNFPKTIRFEKKGDTLAMTLPASFEANADKLSTVETSLENLTAESVEAVHPDAAALRKYGLDKPTAVAEFTVNKKSYKLSLGASSGKNCYAMLDGVNVVYAVSRENTAEWADAKLLDLRTKLIYLPNIETVQSIDIRRGTESHTLHISRKESTASSAPASSGSSKKSYDYTVTGTSGKVLDYEDNYKHFYQQLIGISIFADTEKEPAGEPEVTITYHYFDKPGTDTVAFYPDGDRRYTAVKGGVVYGTVTKSGVDTVFDVLGSFEKGETIPDPNAA